MEGIREKEKWLEGSDFELNSFKAYTHEFTDTIIICDVTHEVLYALYALQGMQMSDGHACHQCVLG
jgi:hypothetical protein